MDLMLFEIIKFGKFLQFHNLEIFGIWNFTILQIGKFLNFTIWKINKFLEFF